MRKSIILFLLGFTAFVSYGQDNAKLFESTEFVWFGLDYSVVRCIGSTGFTDPKAIKDEFFTAWNVLILSEADKYDLKSAYSKSNQITDLSVVERRNKLPDYETFVTNDVSYHLEPGEIEKIIADYNSEKNTSGLGLVYIVKSLNKISVNATIFVVFFDIASKEILWSNKYVAGAQGFGFRNYWAKPIHTTIRKSSVDYNKALRAYLQTTEK